MKINHKKWPDTLNEPTIIYAGHAEVDISDTHKPLMQVWSKKRLSGSKAYVSISKLSDMRDDLEETQEALQMMAVDVLKARIWHILKEVSNEDAG